MIYKWLREITRYEITTIYNICIKLYRRSMILAPYADMAQFYAIAIIRSGTSRYSLGIDCQTDKQLDEFVPTAFPPCERARDGSGRRWSPRIRTGRPVRGGHVNDDWREARLRILWRTECRYELKIQSRLDLTVGLARLRVTVLIRD